MAGALGAIGTHRLSSSPSPQRTSNISDVTTLQQLRHSFYPNVIVILQSILHMVQVLIDIQSVEAALQQCIHAFKSSFPHVKAIIHCMLEWPHFYLKQEKNTAVT